MVARKEGSSLFEADSKKEVSERTIALSDSLSSGKSTDPIPQEHI